MFILSSRLISWPCSVWLSWVSWYKPVQIKQETLIYLITFARCSHERCTYMLAAFTNSSEYIYMSGQTKISWLRIWTHAHLMKYELLNEPESNELKKVQISFLSQLLGTPPSSNPKILQKQGVWKFVKVTFVDVKRQWQSSHWKVTVLKLPLSFLWKKKKI